MRAISAAVTSITAAVVVCAGFAVALAGGPAGASTAASYGITQNLLPGLATATDHGAAASRTPMQLVVSLARPNPAAERSRLTAEYDPASPLYGKYLTPAQFAAQYGVSSSQRAAVHKFLTAHGLRVAHVSTAGDVFTVNGTAAQVESTFGTSIDSFTASGHNFVANTRVPSFPWGLGITNVVGLNSLQKYSLPARAATAQGTCLQSTCVGVTTPQDLWTAYQQPTAYQGQHQGLAVFGEGQTAGVISDLRSFEKQFGLRQIPVTVKHPAGDTSFTDDSGHEEWNIDTQASSGMAPQASGLTMYFGSDLSDADVTRVFSQFTDDASGPKQASASYGECETIPVISPLASEALSNSTIASLPASIGIGNDNDATLAPIAEQAAVEGKTIFASSGDTGSSCPIVAAPVVGAGNGLLNQVVPVTNSPASLPYVVAVGGTVLYTNGTGQRSHEYGWSFSGGGSSLFTAAPAYQQGTTGLDLPCVTAPTTICRGVPDIAAQSGDVLTNGYSIVSDGAASVGAGTSLSAPLSQGMWARVQGATGSTKGNGFANYSFYTVAKNATNYGKDFFDVSSMDTTHGAPATNGLYTTGPGYDYVTGLGVPRVAGLICTVDHRGC